MAARAKKIPEPSLVLPARRSTPQGALFEGDPAARLLMLMAASSQAALGARANFCEILPLWASPGECSAMNSAISAVAGLAKARGASRRAASSARSSGSEQDSVGGLARSTALGMRMALSLEGLEAIQAWSVQQGEELSPKEAAAMRKALRGVAEIQGLVDQAKLAETEHKVQWESLHSLRQRGVEIPDGQAVAAKRGQAAFSAKVDEAVAVVKAQEARLVQLRGRRPELGLDSSEIDDLLGLAARCAPAALEAAHRAPMAPEAIDAMLAAGRRELTDAYDLDAQLVESMLADAPACEAICRLAFKGPVDVLALSAVAFAYRGTDYSRMERLIGANSALFDLPHHDARHHWGHKDQWHGNVANKPSWCLNVPLDRQGAWSTLTFMAWAHGSEDSIKLPLEKLIPAAAAVAGLGESGRQTLLRSVGCVQGEDGEWGSELWAKVHPLGDFSNLQTGIGETNARPAGAGARGDHARAMLSDLRAIMEWRNPSMLFASLQGDDGVGGKSLRFAVEEARGFQEHAPKAALAALEACRAHPASRGAIAAALASRVARGFLGLGADAGPEDYLPDYEPPAAKQDLPSATGVLGKDPMAKLALSAAKVFGLSPENPMGVVGEAKRALIEHAGLSNAAWKNLAAHPELREVFAKVAKAAAQGMSKAPPKMGARGAKAKAEEVMKLADSSGKSSVHKVASLRQSDGNSRSLEAYSRVLSAAAAVSASPEDQAAMLELVAASPRLRSLCSGALPALPRQVANWDRRPGANLFQSAPYGPQLAQDADALAEILPGLVKGMAAKLKRAGAKPEGRAAAAREIGVAVDSMCDLASHMPPGFWSRLDRKDPLSHGARQHEEWVQELRLRKMQADPGSFVPWEALLGAFEHGKASAAELVTGHELHEEGARMHHCVSSYSTQCAEGISRIFSLTLSGAQASTLELAPHDARGQRMRDGVDFSDTASRALAKEWRAVQNNGKCNAQVTHPDLLAAAGAIASAATERFKARTLALAKEKAEKAAAERLASPAGSLAGKLASRAQKPAAAPRAAAPDA